MVKTKVWFYKFSNELKFHEKGEDLTNTIAQYQETLGDVDIMDVDIKPSNWERNGQYSYTTGYSIKITYREPSAGQNSERSI